MIYEKITPSTGYGFPLRVCDLSKRLLLRCIPTASGGKLNRSNNCNGSCPHCGSEEGNEAGFVLCYTPADCVLPRGTKKKQEDAVSVKYIHGTKTRN